MNDEVLRALQQALQLTPDNGALWLHFAEQCERAGKRDEALTALRRARELGVDRREVDRRLVPLLRLAGDLAEALIRVETLLAERDEPALRLELARIELARGRRDEARNAYRAARAADPGLFDEALEALAPQAAAAGPGAAADSGSDDDWASQFAWDDLVVRLDDVVGLDDVKRQVRLRVVAPMQNPQVYQAFGRKGGGGLLLYGPPGCGKTFVARAVAGELGARFHSVSIHDVVDKWFGESEKLVHALFEAARAKTPSVLFFDEFDALGGRRSRSESQFWKTLVNQLLVELDGTSGRNEGLLVVAATNAPWAVDSAFRRPGRFDRVLLVPPPDEGGRAELLRRHLSKVPGGDRIDVSPIARRTAMFTGADLRALVERSAERALEASLTTGQVHDMTRADLEAAAAAMQSTALEWVAQARNHAKYANEGGQYDELVAWLRAAGRW